MTCTRGQSSCDFYLFFLLRHFRHFGNLIFILMYFWLSLYAAEISCPVLTKLENLCVCVCIWQLGKWVSWCVCVCVVLQCRLVNVNSEFVVFSMSIIFLVFVHILFCIYTYFFRFVFESWYWPPYRRLDCFCMTCST